jgi:hypothetical protein
MKKSYLDIFNSNLNNKYKSIPLKTRSSDMGEIKYLPPVSKEWKNTIYSYNDNNIKNLPVNNINANKVIQSYFKLYFKDSRFIDSKFIGTKKRRNFLKRIYTSKIETKHTNSKIIATLYTVNIGKNFLQNEYKDLLIKFNRRILNLWKKKLKIKLSLYIKEKNKYNYLSKNDNIIRKNLFVFKYKLLNESLKWFNLYLKLYLSRAMKFTYYEKLKCLRRYQYNYYLNKFKFDKEIFLPKLKNFLNKIYNNNIEFNIINLKSLTFNADLLTEALALKLKKGDSLNRGMGNMLRRAKLPKVNRVIEKSSIIKKKNPLLLENRYKNFNLLSMMEQDNIYSLTKLLKQTTKYSSESLSKNNIKEEINKDYINISNIIFNSIKYKNIGGIRLEVKGRLTKRYRADRSVLKLKWKGGLKNIDSSYKKLSTVMYRGYCKSNIIHSLSRSKRRIGAFAVKGWVSGK